jgi:acylphosphatase
MTIVRRVVVRGRVQGVGFRMFVEDTAERLRLEGWVRNRRDGSVEAVFAGPEQAVMAALAACREGPRGGHVDAVEAQEGDASLLQQRAGGARFAVLATT